MGKTNENVKSIILLLNSSTRLKMKRELKNIYNQLGNYIIDKNLKNPVTDFSHDPDFLEFIDKANKIKLCIKEIKLNRDVKVTN